MSKLIGEVREDLQVLRSKNQIELAFHVSWTDELGNKWLNLTASESCYLRELLFMAERELLNREESDPFPSY